MKKKEEKVVLLTGAVGGLGSAMSEKLAGEGYILYLLDKNEEEGKKLEGSLIKQGFNAQFIKIDLTSEDDWQNTIKTIVEKQKRIDILINNAGINIRKPIDEMEWEEWRLMMDVNVGSIFLGIKHVLPRMKAQESGLIINTASICGLVGHLYTTEAYTATKGAVTLLTKSIASRYGKFGVRCNSIHPSTVETPFVQELFKDPAKKAERLSEIPLGRLCSIADVSNSVLFLCSDEALFLNGVNLPIDGGLTAY